MTFEPPAIDLEEPYILSNSEIATFRRCRRKWWLSYVLKLQPRVVSATGPLPLGSRIHKSLELYYSGAEGLLEAHGRLVGESRDELLMHGKDVSGLDDEAELGQIMLEGYLLWVADEGIDANLEVIGVEDTLRYPMIEGAVELIGKLDLRVQDRLSGNRFVLDHKTAVSLTTFDDTSHMLTQLKTYMLLDRLVNDKDASPEHPIEGGIYRILKKVKRTARATPPFFREVTIRHNEYAMRAFWYQLQGVLMEMLDVRNALLEGGDHQKLAYPNADSTCKWQCPFYSLCPMFDDGSAVEQMVEDDFEEADPYAYYEGSDKKDEK